MSRNRSRNATSRKISRRTLLAGTAAGAAAALSRFPAPAVAQPAPVKIGLLTVKTGPLAQGGNQMEQGVLTYLKETNYTIGGRKVEFVSADTGGAPAGAKTKVQQLVERDKIDVLLGPLATFELYAINDYIQQQKMPTMSLAAADNLTQRQPNPYLLRASATSSQALHPLGHYTATESKLKRAVAIGEDLSFDYEELGGFQAKYPVVTGWTGGDDALLKSFGDEANGLVSCSAYSLEVETESNHRFIDGMQKNFEVVPGFYAAGLYINCQVVDAALKTLGGDLTDKEKLIATLRAVNLSDTPRGPLKFDHLGNVVGNFYIRRCSPEGAKYGLKLWNKIIKTYENVSQFWVWPEQEFLAHPVYSRDYPPLSKC
jgi:branched-chain amino acid transport system substrate-binding protein